MNTTIVSETILRKMARRADVYPLYAIYALHGHPLPSCEQLTALHLILEFQSEPAEIPQEIVTLYRKMFPFKAGKSLLEYVISGQTLKEVMLQERPLRKMYWLEFGDMCEKRGIELPSLWMDEIAKRREHRNRCLSDPIYRINDMIAYNIKRGADVEERCLSEKLWGLAGACYIVMGGVTPSKYGNNAKRRLETDAYDHCVKEIHLHARSNDRPSPGDIRYLYDYARAAILEGKLKADTKPMDGWQLYEVLSGVFLTWCHKKGITLRPQLLKRLGLQTGEELKSAKGVLRRKVVKALIAYLEDHVCKHGEPYPSKSDCLTLCKEFIVNPKFCEKYGHIKWNNGLFDQSRKKEKAYCVWTHAALPEDMRKSLPARKK